MISVILPVYNGSEFLRDAIVSVLNQTYSDFELIIINDGSTDNSESIVNEFDDPRIIYLSQKNHGLAATLNKAINLAKGNFIARQDQDDISLPSRLLKQFLFLEKNHEVALVGTNAEIWVDDKKSDRFLKHPFEDVSLKFSLLFNNPFVHSSVMIRKNVLVEVGGYTEDKNRQPPEDYELWSRIARDFKVANLSEVHLIYREVAGSMSRDKLTPFTKKLIVISSENIAYWSGMSTSSPEVIAISNLIHGQYQHIPKTTSFKRLENVIRVAAASIIKKSESDPSSLDGLIANYLGVLRYHYFQHLTSGISLGFFSSRFGIWLLKSAKKLMFRISQ